MQQLVRIVLRDSLISKILRGIGFHSIVFDSIARLVCPSAELHTSTVFQMSCSVERRNSDSRIC